MRFLFLGLVSLLALPLFSQQSDSLLLKEVLVSGTKFEVPLEQSGKTIYKVDAALLRNANGQSLSDILNQVPGVHMDGNFGAPGSNISYSIRGGRNKSVLVLLDGIPMNDPTAISPFFDFRFLAPEMVGSAEVLNGGLSTLHGANAASGVMNIQLRDPLKTKNSASISYGSFNTFSQQISLAEGNENFNVLASFHHQSSDGISAADDNMSTEPFDDDGMEQTSMMLKLGGKAGEQLNLSSLVLYNQFDTEIDDGAFTDNPNANIEGRQVTVGFTPEFQYRKGSIELISAFTYTENIFNTSFPMTTEGTNLNLDLVDRHYFTSDLKGVFGINLRNLKQEPSNDSFTILDPYGSLVYSPGNFTIQGGVRLATHSNYDPRLIYNLNPSYLIEGSGVNVKIRAGIANAYITPSLFQLYSFYGNENLDPEESVNLEAGVTLFGNGFSFDAVYFVRDETNPISFISTFDDLGNFTGGMYANVVAERRVEGIEVSGEYEFSDQLRLSAFASFMESDDTSGFYRLPNTKFGSSLNWKPLEPLSISVSYLYTGERKDFDFLSGSEVDLESFMLLDVGVNWNMNEQFTISGGVHNLTDESYVGVYGFSTRPRNYTLGLSYTF